MNQADASGDGRSHGVADRLTSCAATGRRPGGANPVFVAAKRGPKPAEINGLGGNATPFSSNLVTLFAW